MNWFFDGIIFGYLILALPAGYWLATRMGNRIPYRSAGFLLMIISVGWITVFYGSFIEPDMVVTKDEAFSVSDSPDEEVTFAVLSDLHVGPYKKQDYVTKLVETIEQEDPDAVILLGDYAYETADQLPNLTPLYFLTEKYPVYAVMGNHDYDLPNNEIKPDEDLAQHVRDVFDTLNIRLLENSGTHFADDELYLAGLQEIWTNRDDAGRALNLREKDDTPTLLLSHNPDAAQELQGSYGIDLIISGHTHGGQIRLPFLGPVGLIPTELGQAYDQGFFEINGRDVFITSGVGETGPRARLFNPPEIVFLKVRY